MCVTIHCFSLALWDYDCMIAWLGFYRSADALVSANDVASSKTIIRFNETVSAVFHMQAMLT